MTPVIPATITVHLGRPNAPAENVTVPFTEYIKNVASNEIYPTWPEAAIRANILAQISFALNRVYTEYYRSRGYDFDITSTTANDQAFVKDGEIFENISRIVDEIFNNYIGSVEPLYAQFCDCYNTICNGLSQWGTVTLANRGMSPIEILRYYYGDNISLVFNAPISDNTQSYPGIALRRGSFGDDVVIIKRELNRIAQNYPAIPKIQFTNGVYDLETENAVKKFQEIPHQRGADDFGGLAPLYPRAENRQPGSGCGSAAILPRLYRLFLSLSAADPDYGILRQHDA